MQNNNPLECPICFELLDNPFDTFCGHSFCEFCIYKTLETGNCCPICRKNPSPIHPSYTLRSLVANEKERQQITSTVDIEEPYQLSGIRDTYLGNLSYKRKQYAEAIRYYTVAISVSPNPIAYGNRGASYFKLKQFRLALEDYEKAEALDPSNGRKFFYYFNHTCPPSNRKSSYLRKIA